MKDENTQQTIGRLVGLIEGIQSSIQRIDDKIEKSEKNHTDFHIKITSKLDGWTEQHYQNIERWRKEDQEFAERKINLLKKDEISPIKSKIENLPETIEINKIKPIVLELKQLKESIEKDNKDTKKFKRSLIKDIVTPASSTIVGGIITWILFKLGAK